MNPEMIGGLIRHLVTTFGGVLVTMGYTTSGNLEMLAGGAAVLVGIAWSWFVKSRTPTPPAA